MHQFLIDAITAIINNQLLAAKALLDNVINGDGITVADRAIAHYLNAIIAYLEKNQQKAIDFIKLIDAKFLPELSSLAFFINQDIPIVTNDVALSSSLSKSPDRVKGFTPQDISKILSPRETKQPQPATEKQTPPTLVSREIEQFKSCDNLWRYVLDYQLMQLGIPDKSTDSNQPSCEKIFGLCNNCKIPLYFLCQNLKTLSKYWGTDCETINTESQPATPKTPLISHLKLDFDKKAQLKSPPQPRASGLSLLLSPTPPLDTVLSSPSVKATATSPLFGAIKSSSTSSYNDKLPTIQNANKLKSESNKATQPAAAPVLKSADKNIKSLFDQEKPNSPAYNPPSSTVVIQSHINNSAALQDTYIPARILNGKYEDDEFMLFQLDNHPDEGPRKDEQKKDTKTTHKLKDLSAQNNTGNATPTHIPVATTDEPAVEENHLSKDTESTKTDNPAPPKKTNTLSTAETLAKKRTLLKRSVEYNNCLAAMLWFLSGIRDDETDAKITIASYKSSLEIAAARGHIHCLSVCVNDTHNAELFGRGLYWAVTYEHPDCIDLLCTKPITFDLAARIYFNIINKSDSQYLKLLPYLHNNNLNLISALKNNHRDLVFALANGTGKESESEKTQIVILASELGYDCCLSDYMLKNISQLSLVNTQPSLIKAMLAALINNQLTCFRILSQQAITSATKVEVFIGLLNSLMSNHKIDKNFNQFNKITSDPAFQILISFLNEQDLQTAFIKSTELGIPFNLRLLLHTGKIKVDGQDVNEKTAKLRALETACDLKDLPCVIALLNIGIPIDQEKKCLALLLRDKDPELRRNILVHALSNYYLLKLLYELNVLTEAKNNPKDTIHKIVKKMLHTLVQNNEIESLRLLLNNGFDINQMSTEVDRNVLLCSGTPVMAAMFRGDYQILELLLSNKDVKCSVDLSLQLPNNCHFTYQFKIVDITQPINGSCTSQKTVEQYKATDKLNISYSGYSLFHFAAERNSVQYLKLLKKYKTFKPEMLALTNYEQDTPLHVAAKNDRHVNVMYLTDRLKANVNLKNKPGDIPLICAVRRGHYLTVNAFAQSFIKFVEDQSTSLASISTQACLENNIPVQIAVIICFMHHNLNWPNKPVLDVKNATMYLDRLKDIFKYVVKKNEENIIPIVIECLFSNLFKWPNNINKNAELFFQCMELLIKHNNNEGLRLMKSYFPYYFDNNLEISYKCIELLINHNNTEGLQLMKPYISYFFNSHADMFEIGTTIRIMQRSSDLLHMALDPYKIKWECALILLKTIMTPEEKVIVSKLKTEEAVKKIIALKGLTDEFFGIADPDHIAKPPQ